MPERPKSRFDAESVRQLATVNEKRRLEMQFRDANQQEHVVSLPLDAAVALARLICDLSEATPLLDAEKNPRKRRNGV